MDLAFTSIFQTKAFQLEPVGRLKLHLSQVMNELKGVLLGRQ